MPSPTPPPAPAPAPAPARTATPARGAPPARRAWLAAAGSAALVLAGCAAFPGTDPPRVELVGLDPLPGEGLELRFMLGLRVLNPNDAPLDYDGVAVDLDLRGQRFASGVAPVKGTVARYGETVLRVPVTVSALSVARQLIDLVRDQDSARGPGKLAYALRGKLGGAGLGGARFESSGELDLGGARR